MVSLVMLTGSGRLFGVVRLVSLVNMARLVRLVKFVRLEGSCGC